MGIGGAAGGGSLIYALLRAGEFLEEPALIAEARQLAAHLTPDLIAADRALDVIGGAAGAILGLLALHEATGDPGALERAVACGRHLLSRQTALPDGRRAWRTIAARPLTGFSHGAAGIGYALLRLHAHAGEPVFLEAAGDAIAYERSVYAPEARNWPDFRSLPGVTGASYMTSWCHGAPGIGLSRLGGLAAVDTPETRAEIDVALATTLAHRRQGVDQLCCGAAGRAEVLLTGARRLGRPGLAQAARDELSAVAARTQHTGRYRLLAQLPEGVYNPSLFTGTAGIGYQLLRLAHPDRLPSMLLWE
jgi:lantibiotic modifying enzyme